MGSEWIPALVLAVVAAGIDLRKGIIPNWLTLPGLIGGLVWHISLRGVSGIYFALGGAIFASLLFLIPFLRGGMGGGDFKLFLALGAFLGPVNGLRAAIATAIVGGGIAVVALLLKKKRKDLAQERTQETSESGSPSGQETRPVGRGHDWGSIPYGPAIAMGTAWAIFAA